MTEIDFLPDWYLEKRRRESNVQKQYAILGILFFVMIVWNSFATRAISLASAELSLGEPQRIRAEHTTLEVEQLRKRLSWLRDRVDISRQLDAGLDVASTLAEISHAMNDGMVIQKLTFKAESYADADAEAGMSGDYSHGGELPPVSLGTQRYQVRIEALATGSQAVAMFLSDLSDSPYFLDVHLQYTRQQVSITPDTKSLPKPDDTTLSGSEDFPTSCEIHCYVPSAQKP